MVTRTRGKSVRKPRTDALASRETEEYHVAFLHFVLHYSQTRIATLLGMDKTTVGRRLAAAMKNGLATVTLHPPGIPDLEVRLRETFHLRLVRVIPGLPSLAAAVPNLAGFGINLDDMKHDELGKAAAELVGPRIEGNTGIGLAGGRGVAACAMNLVDSCHLVGVDVYSLGVSQQEPFVYSANTVTAMATYVLEHGFRKRAVFELGRGRGTTVPVVHGVDLRLPGSAEEYFEGAMENIHHVIAGVSGIETCWILNDEEKEQLKRQGAVGEVVYSVFGEHATQMQVNPAAPVRSFGVRRLRKLVERDRNVIIICKDKILPLYHLLTAQPSPVINGLVTDAPTATELLKLHHELS